MISGFPGLLNDGREEEIYILREIMLDFIKVMDQKSQVLIGKKVRSKVWLKRSEFVAELEKERGLEKRDLRKRKEIPTKDKDDDTELDNINKISNEGSNDRSEIDPKLIVTWLAKDMILVGWPYNTHIIPTLSLILQHKFI
ncbi:uncharacterized protein OCT59_003582 [Rhizophagus irregularis]|uniref:uncharacterized protein n=1 Tax=Rhizophagus irregularis TaxID=588596 RepID=UPI00332EC860|nr:hypothetical protein OCT59_003582 [Rhizophagus irregularis]